MSDHEGVDFPRECEEMVRALWDFVDGELDDGATQVVQKHLDECSYCLEHVAFERRLLEALGRVRLPSPDDEALRQRVERALAKVRSR